MKNLSNNQPDIVEPVVIPAPPKPTPERYVPQPEKDPKPSTPNPFVPVEPNPLVKPIPKA